MEGLSDVSTYTKRLINSKKKSLFCKYWEPRCTRAIVFISHGYAEHCLYYEPLAQTLASHNYFVITHDHVGHGQSEGTRAVVDNFQTYVNDLFQHLELIRQRFEKLNIYICGHSMGGAIAILAALQKPDYFKGLILIAPAVKTNPELTTPIKIYLAKFLRWFAPECPVAPLDLKLVCSCPKNVEKMRTDPLRFHGFCKAGFGTSLIEAMTKIQDQVSHITCPFVIYQGEEDKICIPEGAVLMYEHAASTDKSIKMYPHAFHNLLYEPNGIAEQVTSDVVDWLNQRAKS